jgi:quinohemoprotein ethanol dehydrogenase
MILADLVIDGQPRKVIMQAPKNGFFYVLDRQTGKLISAENYVEVTWASHVDKETGRPVEIVGQDYKDGLAFVKPTAFGGHNWHPMSFNPKTGLVYIPAQEILGAYVKEPGFKYQPGVWNTGTEFNVYGMVTRDAVQGHLLAWDPVKQKEVWRHPYNNPWNGGVLSTGGNLVFQGTADGRLVAYNATDGEELWSEQAGTGVIAAPVTYLLDGKQYVSVVAGWGGAFGLVSGEPGQSGGGDGKGKLLTFALTSTDLPEKQAVMDLIYAPGDIKDGERLYHKYCVMCHGGSVIAMKGMPDLRQTTADKMGAFDAIVRGGALAGNGMPAFGEYLSEADVAKIKGYVETRQKETAGE